jgi:hypothetical protein
VKRAHSLATEAAGDFPREGQADMEANTKRVATVQRATSEICREAISTDRLPLARWRLRIT